MEDKNKKEELKIIVSIIIMAISFVFIFNTLFSSSKLNSAYSYQINQETDYKVYLNTNDFISAPYLEKDDIYLQALVDYLDFNFIYEFYGLQKANLNYHYDIIATLCIDYQNTGQNVLTKEYPIIKDKFLALEQSHKITISETINLNYQTYYQEALRFKEYFNLPIKAYLKLNFVVRTDILQEGEIVSHTTTSVNESTIELASPIFTITQQQIGTNNNELQTLKKRDTKKLYVLSISSLIFLCALLYFILQLRKNKRIKQTKYRLELEALLHRYRNIIIELQEKLDISDFKVILVKEFEELLDIEEEIRQPILFYEMEDETAIFTILNHNIAYQSILKNKP